jgi:hypothetical protein
MSRFDLVRYMATNGVPVSAAGRVTGTREYRAIRRFYGDRITRRSMVPLMHHIDEGIAVLATLDAKDVTLRAFCLHPLVQDDADLVTSFRRLTELTDSVQVIALAMEYRRVANACTHRRVIRSVDDIELSPLDEVNQMLAADKIQSRKDFVLHHRGAHPRTAELDKYFQLWLRRLGVSDQEFADHFIALQGSQPPIPLVDALGITFRRKPTAPPEVAGRCR